ncbi:hypothetical protein Salat_2966600 [Sesamum alatum]|uniref:Uncharacterized protein n=1 Tax=Sesamum alatum TaxID=300844 RepID=A0AAE1XHV9_9LAMI|nr:hypothetical protein Salat_2966600 [Sesamum alatum]
MDGRGSVVPEALELTGPYLFREEIGASKSTVERKILGPSSFSTGFQTQHSYSSNGTQFISLSSIIDKIRFLHFSVRLRWGVFLRLRLKLRSCLLPNHSSPQDLPGGQTSDQDAGAEKDVEG